jgi:hypothetical protein
MQLSREIRRRPVISALPAERDIQFDLDRAVFLTVPTACLIPAPIAPPRNGAMAW